MPAKLWGSHYNIGRDIVVFEREGKKQLYLVDSLVDDHTYHFTPLEEKVVDGKIKNASSRFDFDLGWVDIEAEEVAAYTARVSSVADDFMIDRALWKTMKVEHCDSPTPGM